MRANSLFSWQGKKYGGLDQKQRMAHVKNEMLELPFCGESPLMKLVGAYTPKMYISMIHQQPSCCKDTTNRLGQAIGCC